MTKKVLKGIVKSKSNKTIVVEVTRNANTLYEKVLKELKISRT